APRALLSFPTRRSSDLRTPGAQAELRPAVDEQPALERPAPEDHPIVHVIPRAKREQHPTLVGAQAHPEIDGTPRLPPERGPDARSEEHTSELQSRENLV